VPTDAAPPGGFRRWLRGETAFLQTQLARPTGITADEQRLYVCDLAASSVLIFDLGTGELRTIESVGKPADVKIDERGQVYVADAASGRIQVFDSGQRGLFTIEPPASGFRPAAVAIQGPRLLAADAGGGRIHTYDLRERRWIDSQSLTDRPCQPAGLCLDNRTMWATDALGGELFRAAGSASSWSSVGVDSVLIRPRHLTVDPQGHVLVTDAAQAALQVRGQDGQLLTSIRDARVFTLPTGVCTSRELLSHYQKAIPPGFAAQALIFVTDQGPPGCVRLFAWGPG